MSNRSDYMDMTNSDRVLLENMLTSANVVATIRKNQDTLLRIIPELKDMVGFDQRHPHHHLDAWEHTLCALSHAPMDYDVRLAVLLHDIGKPHSVEVDGDINHYPFHGAVSARMTNEILHRLGYPTQYINEIATIVEMHDIGLSKHDIATNNALAKKLFEVQKCDIHAHNPEKNERRYKYIRLATKAFEKYEEEMAERNDNNIDSNGEDTMGDE